jgi:hypothetical protein
MPDNNMLIMLGLGAAALWFMNRGGSEENQAGQLTGAAMMASGEGTSPDAPFQAYSAPANPVFFFNQGGEMAQIPGTNVPRAASSGEDIGVYPGGRNVPELEFTVARSVPPAGTSDISPTTPNFSGTQSMKVTPSTVWDQQAQIAEANFMPLLAIQDVAGGGVNILGSNVDISNLSSKEQFRAVNLEKPGAITSGFTTTGAVLGEYVRGFTGTPPDPVTNQVVVSQTASFNTSVPAWAGGNNWWDEG